MSQKQRVLAALRSRGAHGITAVDFAAGRVLDGQRPIMRVAARILELRADGHEIVAEGERDGGCCVYRLLRDAQDAPVVPRAPSAAETLGSLFDSGPQVRVSAIYGDDWGEAA